MEWNVVKKAGIASVNSVLHDLTHLQDSTFAFSIPATQKCTQVDASMLIQYSSHCVSVGSKRSGSLDFDQIGHDYRITEGYRPDRCFDEERHGWSSYLPDIIRSLPAGQMCYFTGYENWLTRKILDQRGVPVDYEVFFNLTRPAKNFLRVYVESAYVRSDDRIIQRPKGFKKRAKVSGTVLLTKKLRNEQIKTPRS